MAYKEFEDRINRIKSPRGAKTELIERAGRDLSSEFSVSDLERACPPAFWRACAPVFWRACPGVSRDMVHRVLRNLKAQGDVECLGRGPSALWRKSKKR